MIIKNRNVKVNKVTNISWECICPDGVTPDGVLKFPHNDVYISGLDADDEPFVISSYDPTFPLPNEGESWILPVGAEFSILQ